LVARKRRNKGKEEKRKETKVAKKQQMNTQTL
jgi:hypothetical protein